MGIGVKVCVGALSVLLLVLLAGCDQPESPPGTVLSDASPSVAITVSTLEARPWRGTVNSFGVVEALEEVSVAAELSGTVSAVHVNEGDRVKTGDLLLELDPQKRQLALDHVGNQVAQAKAALEETRLRLQRRRDLAARESISAELLDNALLAVDGASAAYQQALSAQRLAQRELADTRILSPTDAIVDVQGVEPGEAVQAGASLIRLQALAGLRVHTWVSEVNVSHLRAGSAAQIVPGGIPGMRFPAVIEWVGVSADNATGNFPVKLILQSGVDRLRPGMTVTAELQAEEIPAALILPERALVDRGRRRVVFVVEDGIARQREPLLAAGLADKLLVLSGLESGDRVVTSGQGQLVDGTPVHLNEGT